MEVALVMLTSFVFLHVSCGQNPTFDVDRTEDDSVTYKAEKCFNSSEEIKLAEKGKVECLCGGSTFMSNDSGQVGCYTSKDIGCEYHLGDKTDTYLVESGKSQFSEKIKGSPPSDVSLQIFMWNIKKGDSFHGIWLDVSRELQGFIYQDKGKLHLWTSKGLDWFGQLIKIQFGRMGCLTVKFENDPTKGILSYPFDSDAWRGKFKHISSTPYPYDDDDLADNVTQNLTFYGGGMSFFALILTIIIIASLKKHRSKVSSKILLCLCISLSFLHIIVFSGIKRTKHHVTCQIISSLIQYFMMVSAMWMLIGGINIIRVFVFTTTANNEVRKSNDCKFFRCASLPAWSLPLLIVILTAVLKPNSLGNEHFCIGNKDFCIARGDTATVALVIPISIIVVLNLSAFIATNIKLARREKVGNTQTEKSPIKRRLILTILFGLTWILGFCIVRGDTATVALSIHISIIVVLNLSAFIVTNIKLARRETVGNTQTEKSPIKRILITSLFGLTWLLGFSFAARKASGVFQLFFCIFNSLQGCFIFLITISDQNVRTELKELIAKVFSNSDLGRRFRYSTNASAATIVSNTKIKN